MYMALNGKQNELHNKHAVSPTYSSANFMNVFAFIHGKNAAKTALTPFACVHNYGVNDFKKKAISSVKLFIIYGVLLWYRVMHVLL